MNTPLAAIPSILQLRQQATVAAASVRTSVAQAQSAITLSVVLSIAAAALATGAVVYVVATDHRRKRESRG